MNKTGGREKAQVATEITILVFFLVFLLLAFHLLLFSEERTLIGKRTYSEAKALCDSVALEIDMAVNIGDGYQKEIDMPGYISQGRNYSMDVLPDKRRLRIMWDVYYYTAPLLTSNISGNITSGAKIKIRNQEGGILIE